MTKLINDKGNFTTDFVDYLSIPLNFSEETRNNYVMFFSNLDSYGALYFSARYKKENGKKTKFICIHRRSTIKEYLDETGDKILVEIITRRNPRRKYMEAEPYILLATFPYTNAGADEACEYARKMAREYDLTVCQPLPPFFLRA